MFSRFMGNENMSRLHHGYVFILECTLANAININKYGESRDEISARIVNFNKNFFFVIYLLFLSMKHWYVTRVKSKQMSNYHYIWC